MSTTTATKRPMTSAEKLSAILPDWSVRTDKRDDGWYGIATDPKLKTSVHVARHKRHKAALRALLKAVKACPGAKLSDKQVEQMDALYDDLGGEMST